MNAVPVAVTEIKRFLQFLFRYIAFWLIYFLLCRAAFLMYHSGQAATLPGATTARVFLYGLWMDLSAAAYIVLVPYLLMAIHSLFPVPCPKRLITVYTLLMLLLTALITTCDLEIYKVWGGIKLNAHAIAYLKYPEESMASMASSPVLFLVAICLSIFVAGYCIYRSTFKRFSFEVTSRSPVSIALRLLLFVLFAAVLVCAIRGGTGLAPMNPSFAYFSENQFANHATLNASWNLMHDIKDHFRQKKNQFVYMSETEMRERVAKLTTSRLPDDTEQILNVTRPNIVVIILESWTADVIGALGAEKGIAPYFDELAQKGILFTDFYANGWRTSYGVPAVLSGFPSTPEGSMLNRPNKMEQLPTLAGTLKENGYATSFYYGGDAHFDDMIAFFCHSKFDAVYDKSTFQTKDMNSKWGVHDHVLFERVLADLSRQPEPFFSAMLTISSHEPFEVPMKTVFAGNDNASKFKNAIHYTDKSLNAFFENAKKQPWFKNTLFVLVADHGNTLPLYRLNAYAPERSRIPLLLCGEAIKTEYRGTRRQTTGSQSDIAATILAQLQMKDNDFHWSNNLFNVNRANFAFYNFSGGFALRTSGHTVAFSTVSDKVIPQDGSVENGDVPAGILKDAQAYMQNLYRQYDSY
jgi:phosphoglycerol transferase MdoB-like AlkP superfamily enzyme